MNQHPENPNREERRDQLVAMWRQGKRGQTAVLGLCHQALPAGESLQAGMSIFDTILDHEFDGAYPAECSLGEAQEVR
jgi:hypothetical protein